MTGRRRLVALTLVVHALLAALVVRDARRRDRDSRRWGLFTLTTGLPGALAYVLTNRRANEAHSSADTPRTEPLPFD